jgi:putative nucleotidyltransferase with HDIG domain
MGQDLNILLVDDESRIVEVYGTLLREEGFSVTAVSRADDALRRASEQRFDIVILDQFLGSARGLDLMRTMLHDRRGQSFIIMTANGSTDLAVESLKQGADDFIVKPFRLRDLLRSIDYIKKKRELERAKRECMAGLEQAVSEKTAELKRVYTHVLSSLAQAMEQRDSGTYGHSRRVSQTARLIAAALDLSEQERQTLKTAAMLHDIGKIGITDLVLGKQGPLSAEEQAVIRSHPQKGCEILGPLRELAPVLPAIRHHHERFDGGGYPDGLAGEQIPFLARIIAVADTYDAITSTRPYRAGAAHEHAMKELLHCAGTQFDPRIVEVFHRADSRWQMFLSAGGPSSRGDSPPAVCAD